MEKTSNTQKPRTLDHNSHPTVRGRPVSPCDTKHFPLTASTWHIRKRHWLFAALFFLLVRAALVNPTFWVVRPRRAWPCRTFSSPLRGEVVLCIGHLGTTVLRRVNSMDYARLLLAAANRRANPSLPSLHSSENGTAWNATLYYVVYRFTCWVASFSRSAPSMCRSWTGSGGNGLAAGPSRYPDLTAFLDKQRLLRLTNDLPIVI